VNETEILVSIYTIDTICRKAFMLVDVNDLRLAGRHWGDSRSLTFVLPITRLPRLLAGEIRVKCGLMPSRAMRGSGSLNRAFFR
jgi:hypothetical protein